MSLILSERISDSNALRDRSWHALVHLHFALSSVHLLLNFDYAPLFLIFFFESGISSYVVYYVIH